MKITRVRAIPMSDPVPHERRHRLECVRIERDRAHGIPCDQVGISGGMPMPRNERMASIRIAAAQMNVPWTIRGATVFGRTWRKMSSGVGVPTVIALST